MNSDFGQTSSWLYVGTINLNRREEKYGVKIGVTSRDPELRLKAHTKKCGFGWHALGFRPFIKLHKGDLGFDSMYKMEQYVLKRLRPHMNSTFFELLGSNSETFIIIGTERYKEVLKLIIDYMKEYREE